VEIRPVWFEVSAPVLVALGAIVGVLTRKGENLWAQITTLALLLYILAVLIFWSTGAPFFFKPTYKLQDDDTKKLLLAGTAGLLAQIVIWLNRLAQSPDTGRRILPIYVDSIVGILCGVMGAGFLAGGRAVTVGSLQDAQAAMAGFAGGAVGLGLIAAARRYVPALGVEPAADDKAVGAGRVKAGTCLYAGQEYSDGSIVSMPTKDGTVLKTCDGARGRWQAAEPDSPNR